MKKRHSFDLFKIIAVQFAMLLSSFPSRAFVTVSYK